MADIRSWDERAAHYKGFSGRGFEAAGTITRPANTTQYTAGDVVAGATASPDALVFNNCAVYNGGGGLLTHAICVDSANQATKPNFRLYLFSGSPTLDGDNSPWTPTAAELGSVVAMAEFTSWEVGGTGSGTAGNCFSFAQINKKYRCASADTKLYGGVIERGTFTPLSAEEWTVTIFGEVD